MASKVAGHGIAAPLTSMALAITSHSRHPFCTSRVFQHRGFACNFTTSTGTNTVESRVVQETVRKFQCQRLHGMRHQKGSPGETTIPGIVTLARA